MTKLVIFDLDGTLLDTVEDLGNATNHALRTLGYPEHPIEAYKIFCGRGIYNLFRSAMPEGKATEDNVRRMASYFLPYYGAHNRDCTRPYAGIPGMLARVTAAGVAVAMASNKYQAGVEELAAHFFGGIRFLKILGQREGQPIKPDPAIVAQIMAADPSVRREEVVYVGDSNVDMQTGIGARVRTIGVTWGFRSRSELEAYAPWRIVDTPDALAEAILEPVEG